MNVKRIPLLALLAAWTVGAIGCTTFKHIEIGVAPQATGRTTTTHGSHETTAVVHVIGVGAAEKDKFATINPNDYWDGRVTADIRSLRRSARTLELQIRVGRSVILDADALKALREAWTEANAGFIVIMADIDGSPEHRYGRIIPLQPSDWPTDLLQGLELKITLHSDSMSISPSWKPEAESHEMRPSDEGAGGAVR